MAFDVELRSSSGFNVSLAATVAAGSTFMTWNGSSWIPGVLNRWNGSAWIPASVQRWTGSAWETVP